MNAPATVTGFRGTSVEILPEFRALIPPLSADEFALLEANIRRDGCRDPIVVWNATPDVLVQIGPYGFCKGDGCRYERRDVPVDAWVCGDSNWTCPECGWGLAPFVDVLLDGHNRYDICTRLGLPYTTVDIDLEDRAAAEDWIDTNQLGRRNLTPDQASLLRGRRYNRAKHSSLDNLKQSAPSGQNVHSDDRAVDWEAAQKPFVTTAEMLARQHGVTERTIRRDGDFAAAVETLKPHVPDIEERVMSGDVPSKQAVVEAAREPEKAVDLLGRPHVSHNSGNNEWYTPPIYIQAARAAMGVIDLDPASSAVANQTVGAKTFYTIDTDGLTQSWRGNVWLNPPYAQPLVSQFADAISNKFDAKEIKRACVLVNNATETAWFQRMLESASAVCLLRGRVRFLDPAGEPSGAPLQGQVVLYLGENPYRFAKAFAELGRVLMAAES